MELAIKAAAQTHPQQVRPNPRVGCAIQSTDGMVAVAAHLQAGEGHAEVLAVQELERLGASTEGAQVAVTLEPCAHHGKTPPCAELLIQKKVARVFVGSKDPFKEVCGKGIKALSLSGIDVEVGVCEERCRSLNSAWLFAHQNQRPFVTLKIATSLDGAWKTSLGEDRWVTGPEARVHSHQLRAEADALLTSFNTIQDDDPSLTARDENGDLLAYQPRPLIASRDLKKSFKNESEESFFASKKIATHPRGYKTLETQNWEKALEQLYTEGVMHLMVEAGPGLSQELLAQGLVNEVWHYTQMSYFGESTFRFKKPFADGHLPGQKLLCKDVVSLSNETLLMKLTPSP